MNQNKPILRGRIHQGAFYLTCLLSIGYLIFCPFGGWETGITIYLLSQLILYGISSTYHTKKFKTEEARRHFQRLDHGSIFFLISGTQSCVVLTMLPYSDQIRNILIITWTITIIGLLKVIFILDRYDTLDVVFYILHGVSIVPFFKYVYDNVSLIDVILFILGGIIYISGGIIFRLKRPDPNPKVFGYHEVFHVFTVIANLCFLIPIFKEYILKYFH
ncbi:UPF0073 membrane protein [Astathelohania contejeani]|uniref:UPF0073 membrane protein n=1 Tax=Astathelohania contejeani TaxID=164912 RepID=A0ABQ7I0Y4_9MICR|nr:UPF0073 membrane protein [Thelohania contejeani]